MAPPLTCTTTSGRVPGSFDLTIAGWQAAQAIGLKIQINSTVTRYNLPDLPRLFALVRRLGAMTWRVFFLVPTGRARADDQISDYVSPRGAKGI